MSGNVDTDTGSSTERRRSPMITDDFPKNEVEFHERFSTEEACRDYWSKIRWPNGFVCPACGHCGGWRRSNRDEWICAAPECGKETSLRAGTVLHNSKKSIRCWLMAMFHMSVNKQGISAMRLQRLLGFGCYETALRWLRELRRVMAPTADSEKLSVEVEVDETFLGGVEIGGKGPYVGKQLVVCAVEKRSRGCGRARLRYIERRDGDSLCGFVEEFVAKGTIVYTDAFQSYQPLASMGYVHDPRTTTKGIGGNYNQLKLEDGRPKAAVHLPQVHKVFSLVERIIASAYQGSFSAKHLQGYLDEYCFRFNRRNAKKPLVILQQLINRAAKERCVPLWKSRGREAPNRPTFTRNDEWQRYGSALGRVAYLG